MKTLDEVEARTPIHPNDIPFTISAPGSYYLAANFEATAGLTTAAIIIKSGYVTIDLNGFTLRGSNSPDISGILADGHYENILIRNGSVSRWEEHAIYLGGDAAIVQNVQVAENHGSGISLNTGRVVNCVARNNGLGGISFRPPAVNGIAPATCVVDQCQVFSNGETGILSRRPITISNTISTRNSGSGILLYAAGSTIRNCTVSENFKAGILLSSTATDCHIAGNSCHRNDESGIAVNSRGCRIEGNHLASNEINGITVTQRSFVFKNTAYDNVAQNYSMVNEAIFGPIVTTTNLDGTLTSDHPWANFSYHSARIGN